MSEMGYNKPFPAFIAGANVLSSSVHVYNMGSPKQDDKQSKREMEQSENEMEMISRGKRKEKLTVHAFPLPSVQLPRLNTTPPLE